MGHFFSKSEKVQAIIKGLNLTKNLYVSSIIIGPPYTGKKTLAQSVFPIAPIVSGENLSELKNILANSDEVIITDFEKITNPSSLNLVNKRVIATANYVGNSALIDDLFAFIYTMPPLIERTEDICYLQALYMQEAISVLLVDSNTTFNSEMIPADLSLNNKSLKQSAYKFIMKYSLNVEDIQEVIFHYLFEHLEGKDVYREHLPLYEIPLIKAGLKKYGSQLKLAEVLGINRNTLRKKIYEHKID